MDKELQILKSAVSPDILAIYINKSSSLCSKCVNRKIIISTAGALRIGSPGDFRPLVQPSTYSFLASVAVCSSLQIGPRPWQLLVPNSFGGTLIAYNRNIPCMITGGLHKPGRQ